MLTISPFSTSETTSMPAGMSIMLLYLEITTITSPEPHASSLDGAELVSGSY